VQAALSGSIRIPGLIRLNPNGSPPSSLQEVSLA
jgi:hypothetical protein